MKDDHLILLGKVDGKLDLLAQGQAETLTKIDGLEQRLRKAEGRITNRSSLYSAIIAGAVSLASALLGNNGAPPPHS